MKALTIATATLAVSLTGCAGANISDRRAAASIAPAIRERSAADVSIVERWDSFPNTRLVVQGRRTGRHECWVSGTFFMTSTPLCQ